MIERRNGGISKRESGPAGRKEDTERVNKKKIPSWNGGGQTGVVRYPILY